MAARLETDERQRRTLLAEISHELRTPLAVVQGNLEAIIDGVYPPDPAHLAVDPRRDARPGAADRRPAHAGPVRGRARSPSTASRPIPTLLVADVVRSFEAAAAAAGVELTAAIEGDLPILDIDPVRIREVLANLVANALRHTPAGGRVTVAGSDGAPAGSGSRSATRAAASNRTCCRTSSTGS